MTLEQWLKQNKVKPAKFAEKIGVSRPTINNIKRGVSTPTLEIAIKINRETLGAVGFEEMVASR